VWFTEPMPIDSPRLPAAGLVSSLEQEDRDTLSSYGSFHHARKGFTLIEQGRPHGKLFFVVDGLFHARRVDAGNDILLGRIQPGEWVGEVDLFDPSEAVCNVVAMEPSQYWVITRDNLEEYINNYPSPGIMLMIGLAGILGRRIRDLTRKISEQTELSNLRMSLFDPMEPPPAG